MDKNETTAPNAYLDEYVSSLRGASTAARDEALQREIGTLASLIQATGQGQPAGNGSGTGTAAPLRVTDGASTADRTPSSRATRGVTGPVEDESSRQLRTSGTTKTAARFANRNEQVAGQQPQPRTQQQRQSELFVAQRFARYFMGRLLERIGGRQASLNSLDASQMNVFNFYRRAVAEKLRDLAEERTDYHSFRRALRELYQRATDGAVSDLWAEFVRYCTTQRNVSNEQTPATEDGASSLRRRSSPRRPDDTNRANTTTTVQERSATSSSPPATGTETEIGSTQGSIAGQKPDRASDLSKPNGRKSTHVEHEAGGDETASGTRKQKELKTFAMAGDQTNGDQRQPRVSRDGPSNDDLKEKRQNNENDDDDDDDDVEHLVKVDLERERTLLELENVVTTVVDAAPETFLLDKAALTARFLETLQKHGNFRATKSCLALLSYAAEHRLRQVLELTLQCAKTRRGIFPGYSLPLAPPSFSTRAWIAQERKKISEERARKRYALNLPDEGEQNESGAQLLRRKRAAEDARHREKVEEANVALSHELDSLKKMRRKRPAPPKIQRSTEDRDAESNIETGTRANASVGRGSSFTLSHAGPETTPSKLSASEEFAASNRSGPTVQLRDVVRALEMDPLTRKSRLVERWASRIQRMLATS